MAEELVKALRRVPKVKAVALVSQEGVSGDELPEEVLKLKQVIHQLEEMSEYIGSQLTSAQVEIPLGLVLVERIDGGYILILGEKDMNVGRVKLALKKYLK